jgi:hypothetical protein
MLVRPEGLSELKKILHLIGSQIRDLPACSIVPQPTTLPRGLLLLYYLFLFATSCFLIGPLIHTLLYLIPHTLQLFLLRRDLLPQLEQIFLLISYCIFTSCYSISHFIILLMFFFLLSLLPSFRAFIILPTLLELLFLICYLSRLGASCRYKCSWILVKQRRRRDWPAALSST